MGCIGSYEDYCILHDHGHVGINAPTRRNIQSVCEHMGWTDDRGWFRRTFVNDGDSWFLDKIRRSREGFEFAFLKANIDFWSNVEVDELAGRIHSNKGTD